VEVLLLSYHLDAISIGRADRQLNWRLLSTSLSSSATLPVPLDTCRSFRRRRSANWGRPQFV